MLLSVSPGCCCILNQDSEAQIGYWLACRSLHPSPWETIAQRPPWCNHIPLMLLPGWLRWRKVMVMVQIVIYTELLAGREARLTGRCGLTGNMSASNTGWQTHMLRCEALLERDKTSFSVSVVLSLTLSNTHTQSHTQTSAHTRKRTTLSWGPEQHLLTVCLMIINEPSWVGREALSHPLHRQEEDWEPQGHPTVSITLPNNSSPSFTCTYACVCTKYAHTV